MDPDQISVVVKAAQRILSESPIWKTALGFLPGLGGAILGWLGAYLQFRYTFRKGLRKEHYYQARENVITIIKLHSEFLSYIYQSYKAIKTVLNTGNLVSAEAMNDFITEYQSRLALSHQMSKIEFPGQTFDTAKITAQLRQLEDGIAAINNDIVAAFEKAVGSPPTAAQLFQALGKDRVDAFNKLNAAIIDEVTKEIGLQENRMIQILQEEARHLGLVNIAK